MDETSESTEYRLLKAVQEARAKYLSASKEFDHLNQQVLLRMHSMLEPDGIQAIQRTGKNVRDAFQHYRAALDAYVVHILPREKTKQ